MIDQKVFAPQLEKVLLKKLLHDTVKIMEGQARVRGIKLIFEFKQDDVQLDLDQMRTVQILLNLISNAIKFSPDEEKIEIKCNYLNLEQGTVQVQIQVVDHGIGISE